MDKHVQSDEARRNLRALLDGVEHHGDVVTIHRYDKPVAVIVPVDWFEQAQQEIQSSREE